jgi:uncharacterized damage-inducible protein DinB
MATQSERREMIQKIRQLPEKLEAAVKSLSDAQLDTPVGEGKWTIRQITHHIVDGNLNAYLRMKFVITETKPILKPYDQDKWAALVDTARSPVQTSLSIFKGLAERWTQLLESLPESSWTREGIHLENGKVSLEDLLATYSRHGETHLQQILNFKQARKW